MNSPNLAYRIGPQNDTPVIRNQAPAVATSWHSTCRGLADGWRASLATAMTSETQYALLTSASRSCSGLGFRSCPGGTGGAWARSAGVFAKCWLVASSALRAWWTHGQDRRPCRGVHAGEPHHRQLLHLAAGVGRERGHRLADPAEPARARPGAHPRCVREMAARPSERHCHLRSAHAARHRRGPAVLRVAGQDRGVLREPLLRVRHELHPEPTSSWGSAPRGSTSG